MDLELDLLDELKEKLRAATRLTRDGRLQEATAEIQAALGNAPSGRGNAPAATSEQAPIDVEFRVVEEEASKPAAEPAHPGSKGSFLKGRYTCAAGSREYRLYVPGGQHARPLPLVVMLHGCTQSPEIFATGTRMNRIAEESGCHVLYPAQSQEANNSRCWNWFQPQDQQRDQGEPAIIAGATQAVARAYQVDPARIYVAGLSAGGAMATILGMTWPDLYAAVGVHSGLPYGIARDLPSALAAMRDGGSTCYPVPLPGRAAPLIVFHGDADRTVHPRNADAIVEQWILAATGTSPTAPSLRLAQTQNRGSVPGGRGYTRTVYRDSTGDVVLEQWRIEGGAHAWSGGSPQGSHTDPQGPDASAEMLRFFREHPLAAETVG